MTSMATPVRMKDYGIFNVRRIISMPRGWLIPRAHVESGRLAAALDRLRTHGLTIQRVTSDIEVAVERVVITNMTRAERPFQGHQEVRLTARYQRAMLSAQEGALFIPPHSRLDAWRSTCSRRRVTTAW